MFEFLGTLLGAGIAYGIFTAGYQLGRLRGLKETLGSSSYRLSVLASAPKTSLERLLQDTGSRDD